MTLSPGYLSPANTDADRQHVYSHEVRQSRPQKEFASLASIGLYPPPPLGQRPVTNPRLNQKFTIKRKCLMP